LGDLCKSFFKRRFGLRRGASLPVVDQLDLVFGSWLLCLIFVREWFLYNFNVQIIVIVLVMTPLLHISMNIIGYKMGVKKEPW
jgi:CDP-2,3-bis-(O-geranylgeranyl)-sn-glycerol synthase